MMRITNKIFIHFYCVAALCAVAATSVGCKSNPHPKDRPNLLLISVDALRADHLGLYGYRRDTSPKIDEWFQNGLVFDNAYSTEANTTPSVVSFLSGLLPQEHRVRLLYQKVPKKLKLVPDRLAEIGYQTAGVVSNMVLTKEATELDAHFDYFDDYVSQQEPVRPIFERKARPTTDAVLRCFKEDLSKDRPYFLWVHYIDPHGPYLAPKNKPKTFTHETPMPIDMEHMAAAQRQDGVTDGLAYVDFYDEEIAYADREIGRLLDTLKKDGRLDNTLVIFTADHGESMMEHETWFTHGYQVYDEIIRVPLAFIGPNIQKKRVKEPVSIMNLAPTMLQAAKLDLSNSEFNRVLNADVKPGKVYAEATQKDRQWRTLILGTKKRTVALKGQDGTPEELRKYDLKADPKELSPSPWDETDADGKAFLKLIARDPDKAGFPESIRWGGRIKAPKVAPGVDDVTLERLKALGYVEE